MSTNALAMKAVLASVTIRRWTGRRLDRQVTDEVNQANGAEADAGRYNKLLIAKVAFEEVTAIVRAARTAHYVMTLPWQDEGSRILPAELIPDFQKRFQTFRIDFEKAADEFTKKYPSYMTTAKKRLGRMFKEEDYPQPKSVRGLFDFKTICRPCPTSDDFRIKIAKEHETDLKTTLEAEMKEALQNAMRDPVDRITEVVGKLSERLRNYTPGEKKGVFRDSLVENIQELVTILPAFNLTGDAKMTALTDRIAKELCKNEAQTLRDDEKVRKAVVKSADAILKQAESLFA